MFTASAPLAPDQSAQPFRPQRSTVPPFSGLFLVALRAPFNNSHTRSESRRAVIGEWLVGLSTGPTSDPRDRQLEDQEAAVAVENVIRPMWVRNLPSARSIMSPNNWSRRSGLPED